MNALSETFDGESGEDGGSGVVARARSSTSAKKSFLEALAPVRLLADERGRAGAAGHINDTIGSRIRRCGSIAGPTNGTSSRWCKIDSTATRFLGLSVPAKNFAVTTINVSSLSDSPVDD
jgi:hypothetical protein